MDKVHPLEYISSDIDELYISIRIRFFYETHRKKILLICFILIIILIICIRYLWKSYGCTTTIPNNYQGWWFRSPKGGQMVPCIYPNTVNLCGAGNYQVIVIYTRYCNINYIGE